MTIHEFGKENNEVIVLVHPSIVMWDYFEYVIPLMEESYHLVIPAIPGYDPDEKSDFTSVEEISSELEKWIITRFIAIKDFIMIYIGKIGGAKLLEKAFSTDELSEEDASYAAGVLKMLSAKTIWRTFESCNNYSMPKHPYTDCEHIEYWVAEKEIKDRRFDAAYIRKAFPYTVFRIIKDMGHGGLAPFNPEKFVRGIEKVCGRSRSGKKTKK